MITLKINGKERTLPEPTALLAFLREREIDPRVVVVEHNGQILRGESLAGVVLGQGDTVEIVHMVGGG